MSTTTIAITPDLLARCRRAARGLHRDYAVHIGPDGGVSTGTDYASTSPAAPTGLLVYRPASGGFPAVIVTGDSGDVIWSD